MKVGRAEIDAYLAEALAGHARAATRVALDLVDAGLPAHEVIADLLAPAQREVGDRWQRDELSVADEHLATGVAEVALHAIAATVGEPPAHGFVVVACAEGDWHGVAAHMLAEQLRSHGMAVAFLGASTPTDHVSRFVADHRPDAIAVSCNVPLFFAGLARLVDAAHAHGVPVLAGGRALGRSSTRATRLGADAWAPDVASALPLLERWRNTPPPVSKEHTALDLRALKLDAEASQVSASAFDELLRRAPAVAEYDERQTARTREDLTFIVRFIAAARLVDDREVFTSFLTWLTEVLAVRRVPVRALVVGLEAVRHVLVGVDEQAAALAEVGLAHVAAPSGAVTSPH